MAERGLDEAPKDEVNVATWMHLWRPLRILARAPSVLLLVGLVGCATLVANTTSKPPAGSTAPVHPAAAASASYHVAAIGILASHGDIVRAAGNDFTQAMAGNLPCSACHAGISPTQPSPNKQAPSCFACHAGGPDGSPDHPIGWFDLYSPSFHGAVVRGAGYDVPAPLEGGLACNACHAAACAGEPSPHSRAPSCFSCHEGGPDGSADHPVGWLDRSSPNFHGASSMTAGFGPAPTGNLACSTCHAGDSSGQSSPNHGAPNCYACHTGGPDGSAKHPPGWNDATSSAFHGATVKAAGYDYTKAKSGTLSCNTCHAGESPGQASPNAQAPNCYSCHAGGPDGSAGHPPDYNSMTSANFHGLAVKAAGNDYTKAKAGALTCSACHAGTSSSQASPNSKAPNCYSCHAGGPNGSPGHPVGWTDITSATFHGSPVASAGFDFTKATSGSLTCNTCHAGLTPDQKSPVAAAPNCYACHPGGPSGSPHAAGWGIPRNAAFHGTFLANNGGYQQALAAGLNCNVCHNTTQNAASPWANAPNCYTCHLGGPSGTPAHPVNWYIPDANGTPPHAPAARADLNHCARCHNTVARGMPNPGPDVPLDCWSCHNGPGG